jgi:DNA (cytosine-5)-methyltransferase 1
MRFVSWFAGIGGFDLGLERAGHTVVAHSEIDPYCRRVLERHWPGVPNLGDIRNARPEDIPDAELWCGGFPCQPYSVAGKRKATDDERDLWPAWHRLIAARRPAWIFGENVPGLLSAERGAAWGRIVRDLAALGYVGEWAVLGARDVGAPHRRDRLWIVAHLADADESEREALHAIASRNEAGRQGDGGAAYASASLADASRDGRGEGRAEPAWQQGRFDAARCGEAMADPARDLRAEQAQGGADRERAGAGRDAAGWWATDPADLAHTERAGWLARWAERPGDASGAGARDRAGRSSGRQPQPELGRVAHGIPNRVDRLRALGNAVVPQVVEAIARHVWPQEDRNA